MDRGVSCCILVFPWQPVVPNNTVLGVMQAKLGGCYVSLAQKLQFSKLWCLEVVQLQIYFFFISGATQVAHPWSWSQIAAWAQNDVSAGKCAFHAPSLLKVEQLLAQNGQCTVAWKRILSLSDCGRSTFQTSCNLCSCGCPCMQHIFLKQNKK